MRLNRKRPNDKVLKPVRANLSVEADYAQTLRKLIALMHKDVLTEITSAYQNNPPEITTAKDGFSGSHSGTAINQPSSFQEQSKTPRSAPVLAQDVLPAELLRRTIAKLVKKWGKRFDRAAPKVAKYFAQAAASRSDRAMQKILRDAGWTVKFKLTPSVRDTLEASIAGQVGLIKSIPQQYLQKVEGSVMRSVMAGHDLKVLTDDIQKTYGKTYKRAAFIARDQNAKASATILRARQIDLGLKQAVWMHSGGGKTPRPHHVKWGKEQKTFDIAKGMWDPEERKWIQPGELVNCGCTSRPVVKGF